MLPSASVLEAGLLVGRGSCARSRGLLALSPGLHTLEDTIITGKRVVNWLIEPLELHDRTHQLLAARVRKRLTRDRERASSCLARTGSVIEIDDKSDCPGASDAEVGGAEHLAPES